jgi:hypothetical protein
MGGGGVGSVSSGLAAFGSRGTYFFGGGGRAAGGRDVTGGVISPFTRPRQVPTQFKATQLVVAIAVWAIAFSESRAKREATSTYRFYFPKASEQYYITIG